MEVYGIVSILFLNYIMDIYSQVDATDASYPSVNTCVHYLKLPEYSSEEIMRERLLAATMEKGFHLNWTDVLKWDISNWFCIHT